MGEGRGREGFGPRQGSDGPQALFKMLKVHCLYPERGVIETGALSGCLAHDLAGLDMVVEVIDARRANAVMRLEHNRTDANDVELLAEIARPRSGGEERDGTGEAGPSGGAGSRGAPAARYGEHGPRAARVIEDALSQGCRQAGRPCPRGKLDDFIPRSSIAWVEICQASK